MLFCLRIIGSILSEFIFLETKSLIYDHKLRKFFVFTASNDISKHIGLPFSLTPGPIKQMSDV